MEKTTVYLPSDLRNALKETARARQTSEAELIREGIALVTAGTGPPQPRVPLFASGDPTLAERVDEVLRGFGERSILLDTSGLLAALDQSQRLHEAAAATLLRAAPPLLLSPFVLAEMDYLLATRVGIDAEIAFLDEVGRGVYQLEPMSSEDVTQARVIVDRYRDLDVGLADASILVLAARRGARDVLTLDERHFRTMRTHDGSALRILPADAS